MLIKKSNSNTLNNYMKVNISSFTTTCDHCHTSNINKNMGLKSSIVGLTRFELVPTPPKSVVLPLHQSP